MAASARTTAPRTSPRTARAWRRRSVSSRSRLLTAYQIHSPHVVVAETPWTSGRAAARRRHRYAPAGARHRRDAPPIAGRFCSPSRRRASSAPRMPAGAARLTGVVEATVDGDGAARRRAQTNPRRAWADDPPAQLRSRPRSHRPLCRRGPRQRGRSSPGAARPATPCSISAATSRRGLRAGRRRPHRGCRPVHLRGSAALFQLPPRHPPRRGRLRPARQRHRACRQANSERATGVYENLFAVRHAPFTSAKSWHCSGKSGGDKGLNSYCQPRNAACIRSA